MNSNSWEKSEENLRPTLCLPVYWPTLCLPYYILYRECKHSGTASGLRSRRRSYSDDDDDFWRDFISASQRD
eukprot:1181664-Prorocentrum_minimum.AAC.4